MSDVEIKYNDKRVPLSGTGPTPYVTLNNEVISYGNRWGIANRITLNGQITGCDFDSLYYAQTGLVDIFFPSYRVLKIYEGPDGTEGYAGNAGNGGNGGGGFVYQEAFSYTGCSIDNISFSNAGYNKVVDYSVEILSYPSGLTGYFSGVFGVLDPKDEIKISEDQDGFGTIEHTTEARGFYTTSKNTAINNAKNYVASRTGISRILTTPAISGIQFTGSISTPVLISLTENLDRLNLIYSVQETYKFKLFTGDTEAQNNYNFNNYYLTSYSTSLSSGAGDDFVTASIQGEIKAGITGNNDSTLITELTSQLASLDPFRIVSGKYGSPNGFNFCKDPIEMSIQEDLKSRKINFNASYDNLEFYSSTNDKYVYSGCYLDAAIDHTTDNLTKIDTINVRGEIKCRGSVTHKYNNSLLYLGKLMTAGSSSTEPRIYDFVNDYYESYYGASYKFALNPNPANMVVDANPQLGTISLDISFNNKDSFTNIANTDYSIEYTPFNTVFVYGSSCNDATKHLAVNLNTKKREKVSLEFSISNPGSTESSLLSKKDTIFSSFVTSFLNPLLQNSTTQDTLQIENSNINISNSSFTGPSAPVQGSIISASKVYSYDLKESESNNRLIIKS